MTNDDTIALLKREVEDAQGYDSDVLAENRANALDYYFGRMAQTATGVSNIVSHDVADTIHSLMAQSTEMYKGSSIEFDAESEEDEPQAQMESDAIRAQIERNDEWATFDAASFDALLQDNGWIGVEILEEDIVERESYTNIMDEAAVEVMQPTRSNQVIDITDSEQNDDGTVSFTLTRTTTKRKLNIRCIAPDVMLFSPAGDQFNLQELRFVAERRLYTVADLEELGLSAENAASITTVTDDYWPAIVAREAEYSGNTNENQGGKQPATILKETFICYILIDQDDTGKVERRRIHYGGSIIISDEPINYVPYVTGSPLPVPHRIQGQGMYKIMRQVQEGKTHILRQYMENLKVLNKSRVAYVRGNVNTNELQDARVNGAVGCETQGDIWGLPSNNAGPECIMGLDYLDKVRTTRGGASLDMQRGEMQVAGSSAMAAAREYESKEMMAGYYTKNLAHTLLKNTFLLVHKVLREEWTGDLAAKIRGKWITTRPQDWPERESARVTVGMTSGEKAARVQGLNALIAWQTGLIEKGQEGVLTDKSKVYNAAADWIRAADLGPNPEEYIIDPNSDEAKQAAASHAQQQQQQQQAMQQQQQAMMDMQRQIEAMKNETDRWKTEVETQFKYYDANLDAEVEEAKMVGNGVVALNKQRETNAGEG